MKSVTGNKIFWKTVAPFFSYKFKASKKITISENEKLIINDQKYPEVFKKYFNSIVKELNIPIDQNFLNDASIFDDPIIAPVRNTSAKDIRVSFKIRKRSKTMTFFLFIMLTPIK